jgi:single-strand DNA-binding protein
MSSYEQHILVGNLGADPETTTLDSGASVCKFRIATNRKYKDNEYTTWWTVEAWGKLGEICQQYLSKGRSVLVMADRLEAYAFTNDEGEAKAVLQVTARDVQFIGGTEKDDAPPW